MSAIATGRARRDVLAWALVVLVAPLGLLSDRALELTIVGIVGLAVIPWAARKPGPAIAMLVLFVPLQLHVLALAYRLGVSGGLARGAGYVKEALLAGLLIAALRHATRHSHRPDQLDRAAILFIALTTAYLVVPAVLSPVVGELFPAAPTSLYGRALALRADLGFIIILLIVRSTPIDPIWRRRIVGTLVVVGAIVAAGAVVETARPELWVSFEQDFIGLDDYFTQVLQTDPRPQQHVVHVLGQPVTRAGSVLGPLSLGFYLLAALGWQLAAGIGRTPAQRTAIVVLIAVGIVGTVTRSAVLGAAVAILVVTLRSGRLESRRRTAVAGLSIATVIAMFAIAGSTGLADRTTSAIEGSDASTEAHLTRTSEAAVLALRNPLGLGLGVQPDVARRTSGTVILSENAYIQVAVELGLLGGALFLWFIWSLTRTLARHREDPMALGMLGAIAGLFVGGLFLHAWSSHVVTWTAMIAAGLALPRKSRVHDDPEPEATRAQPVEAVRG